MESKRFWQEAKRCRRVKEVSGTLFADSGTFFDDSCLPTVMWRRRVSFSEKLDPGSVAWSRRETCITSHERSGKGLSEREIRSVVGRQGMAQLPDTE